MKAVTGGVTAAGGFRAAGVHAGIKAGKADMALIVSDAPAVVAGTFTNNKVQAAPVILGRERLAGRRASAIVVNSGSANACTGPQGMADARAMAALAARALGVDENGVFPCSTGTIGKPLPMDKIRHGIQLLVPALSKDGGDAAAKAIMTTDTVDKQYAVEIQVDGRAVRVGGMAKGAGMIEPNMATMLAFLTTDAAVLPEALQSCLSAAVEASFNRISVDGDQSTNDTALLLANGMAGNRPLDAEHPAWDEFCAAVGEVCRQLAWKIVKDGEGATKFVTITVQGAVSKEDASKVARAVANSLLVKTSWFGGDPNWGRIIAAAGYSGADVATELTDVSFDGVVAVRGGQKAAEFALQDLERILKQKAFGIQIDLHKGAGTDTVYTCDCSEEYVRINADYMT